MLYSVAYITNTAAIHLFVGIFKTFNFTNINLTNTNVTYIVH